MEKKSLDVGGIMERFSALESHAITRMRYDVDIFSGLKNLVLDAIAFGKEMGRNDLRHEAFKAEYSNGHSDGYKAGYKASRLEFASAGGRTTSPKRADASKENGKKGGRPRKDQA